MAGDIASSEKQNDDKIMPVFTWSNQKVPFSLFPQINAKSPAHHPSHPGRTHQNKPHPFLTGTKS